MYKRPSLKDYSLDPLIYGLRDLDRSGRGLEDGYLPLKGGRDWLSVRGPLLALLGF